MLNGLGITGRGYGPLLLEIDNGFTLFVNGEPFYIDGEPLWVTYAY